MIDFVRSSITDVRPQLLLKHKDLNFVYRVGRDSEIIPNRYGVIIAMSEYKNLNFILREVLETEELKGYKKFTLEGSLHKYFNNGIHNFNHFAHSDLQNALLDIKKRFELPLKNYTLRRLEVGFNIEVSDSWGINVNSILRGLKDHRKSLFSKQHINNSDYYMANTSRHEIKIYDKSLHYRTKNHNVPNNILRVEVKYKTMCKPKSHGIYTLYDLHDARKVTNLAKDVLRIWDEIIFIDPTIDFKNLKKHTKEVKLDQWKNPDNWIEWNAQKRKDERTMLRRIIRENSKNIQTIISNIIREKISRY